MTPSAAQKSSLTAAAAHYHELVADPNPASFLEERGLLDEDLLRTFLLGYVGEDPLPGHEAYRGRLVIPYRTPSGVVSLRFRALGGATGAKYLGVQGDATYLYNVAALHRPGGTILVCEGELDAVAAEYAGHNAVAVPGAQAWKPHWARLLQDYERVVVVADGDEAGAGMAKNVRHYIEWADVRLMPDGHDVNSFLLEYGADAFAEHIAS